MKIKQIPDQIKIIIEAQLKPTEDPKKVETAIKNIIGIENIIITQNKKNMLISKTKNQKALDKIYEKIRDKHIFGVTRRLLMQNKTKDNTWIYFNKQAAFVNVYNICENEIDTPLGHIKVTINTNEPQKIIDWLAPSKNNHE